MPYRTRVGGSWVVLASGAMLVSACAGGTGGQPGTASAVATMDSTRTVCTGTLALLAPLTGGAALAGREQVDFATLAVDDFNSRHGSSYSLRGYDTQLDTGQASTQAQAVASDDAVIGVLGPSSSQEAAAVGPVLASAGLAYVSGSATNPTLTQGRNPTFFRVVPTDAVQAPTVAAFMESTLKSRKVTIVEERTDYGTGLSRRLREALGAAGIATQVLPVAKDKRAYDDTVSRIDRDSDTVFLAFQVAAKAQQFGQTLVKAGRDVTLFASEGSYTPEFSIPGAYVTALAPDIRGVADASGVVARFRERFGDFSGLGAPMYVAAQAVLDSAQRSCQADGAPADRAGVLAGLPATRLPSTILGREIGFDQRGDVAGASFTIFRVEPDGSFDPQDSGVPAS